MARKSTAVIQPNLGLYYDRSPLAMSPRMLQDGLNFRVILGKLSNLNLGWSRFGTFTLNGPVVFVQSFTVTGGTEQLVFATYTDIYKYVSNTSVVYLTPRYDTGTVSRSGNAVIGVGTAFASNARNGDQIHFGDAAYTDPNGTWDTITNITDDTHLTTTGSGTVASGPYTIRKLFTGSLLNVWQSDVFVNASPSGRNELWMTNGLDSIIRWDGAATQVELMSSTLGFTAKALRVYSNMMLFANVTQSGTSKVTDLINSDVGQPQNAGSASTGVSQQFKVHAGTDEILRLEPLGDNLVIYSANNRITLSQFVGSPLFFIFRQVSSNIGIVAPNALVNFGTYHEFVGVASEYYFDGAAIKPINTHVWREILRQQDPARITYTMAIMDQQNGDIIWAVPLTSDASLSFGANTAYSEHYLEDPGQSFGTPYSKRQFPFMSAGKFNRQTGLTWDQIGSQWQNTNFRWNDRFFAASFPLILVGDSTGKLYSVNVSQAADGAALNSYVTFGRRAMFDGRIRGLLTRVYPFATPFVSNVNVTVRLADSANGVPITTDTQSFDQSQPEGGHFTIHYRRGRFFEVQFGTNGTNLPWEILGYDTDVRPGGRR